MSEDLVKRLRGKYSVGENGVYEDRDFGDFTPRITLEAAELIEYQSKHIEELELELAMKDAELRSYYEITGKLDKNGL